MRRTWTTPLCGLLGIRHPIILAGMAGGPITPELVAAVSGAGGLGTFGAHGMQPDALRSAIRAARALTRAPIAANVLLAPPRPPASDADAVHEALAPIRAELGLDGPPEAAAPPPSALELLTIALEEGVQILSTGLGDPAPIIPLARDAGAPVIAMVATVADAVRVVESGADVVVAQGGEAGGHRSNFEVPESGSVPLVGTMALVPQVVAAVDVPVVAAGGIMNGAGLVGALALGAQGVQMGSRFLRTPESGVSPGYRRRLGDARDTDSEIIVALSGRPARGLRNRVVDALEQAGLPNVGYPRQAGTWRDIRAAAEQRGDDATTLWAGQAAGLARDDVPAGRVVTDVLAEADAVMSRLDAL